jgi:hypothetical protein
VIQTSRYKEDPRQFNTLRKRIHERYLPLGPMEEYWVEVIVGCLSRTERYVRAEIAAIAGANNGLSAEMFIGF